MALNVVEPIETKLGLLADAVGKVEVETVRVEASTGRILGQDILNFRDSPASDVSAMDGYAFSWQDIVSSEGSGDELRLAVRRVAAAGAPLLRMERGEAIRIFTGGVVPEGAGVVIPREVCRELQDEVAVQFPVKGLKEGWNIRRRGENATLGSVALHRGVLIDGPKLASIVSSVAENRVEVYRKVRVRILNTGDELLRVGEPIEPWQIRDSNGPFLEGMLSRCGWVQWDRRIVRDDRSEVHAAVEQAMREVDAVLITGGVSMGDTDHVPGAVSSSGGKIIFHRLPIRPGAPILGATSERGQLVMGLPGNPMSVAVTFRRFAWPLLRRLGGFDLGNGWGAGAAAIRGILNEGDEKTLHLHWYRLVQVKGDGCLELVGHQGSGDVIAMGRSDGFIEVPAGQATAGEFRYFAWDSVA